MTPDSPSPSDAQWSRLESVIQRLEEGWRSGIEPDLPSLLASVPPVERREITVECVKVDMECRWRNRQPVQIEEYLERWPDLLAEKTIVRELLESECYSRVLYDSPPSDEELQSRFPEIALQIKLQAIVDAALIDRVDLNPASQTTQLESLDDTAVDSTSEPPLILLGEQLGRYKIVGKIGTGGQGDVYHAVDTQLDRNVALKLLRNSDTDLLKRFAREGKFAASVEHRSICRIYHAGTDRGIHFIVMELIDGQTVQQRLQDEGPFEQREAVSIAKEIAGALSKVHTAGIIHRDIKSGNIMIDQEGVPVLMDFGLARPVAHSEGMTTTEDFGGTLAFMSPEQAGGYAPDHRSDIYSLGVVLYQMLTGEVPFGLLPAEFFKQIGKSPPPSPLKVRRDLDRNLDTICRKAMAIRPDDRYESADQMVDALQRSLDGKPQLLKPPWSRRRIWAALAAAVLLVVAMAGVFIVRSYPKPAPTITQRQGPRRVERWIETPGGVLSFAINSDASRIFVADDQLNKTYPIREFDIETGKEVSEPIPFGDLHFHNELVLSPDGRTLFAPNFYFHYISRIDLTGSREPESIRIIDENKEISDDWRWNSGMALTPDGTLAVIPMGHDARPDEPDGVRHDQLAIVDLSKEPPKLLTEIPLEDEPSGFGCEIPRDETAIYVTTSPRPMTDIPKVYRVDLRPPYSTRTFSVPDGQLQDVVVSSLLDRIYIADSANRRIWVVNRSNFDKAKPDDSFALKQRAPLALALAEERNLLAVLCPGSRSLHLVDAVTGLELTRYEGLRKDCRQVAFSTDCTRLFVNCGSLEGGVGVIDVPDFEVRIAFSSDRAGGTDQIYTMKADGTDVRPLFESASHSQDRCPCWSPDGQHIAFVTDRRPKLEICITTSTGKQLRQFENSEPRPTISISWSPSGNRIAYIARSMVDLHVLDVETGSASILPCNLPPPHVEFATVCWETETSLIVTAKPNRNGTKQEVLRVNALTGQATPLTNEPDLESSCLRPATSRDGRMAVQRYLVRDGPPAGIYLLHENLPRERMFEKLTEQGPPFRNPGRHSWFPNGDKIVFCDLAPDSPFQHLFVLDVATKTYRQITSGDWSDNDPNVSPPLPDAWLRGQ